MQYDYVVPTDGTKNFTEALPCALGAHGVLVGRKSENLEATANEIRVDGGRCSLYAVDIRDEEGLKAVVTSVVADTGRIHGLMNNAGGQLPAPLSAVSKKVFEAVVSTNLTGGFLFARKLYPQSMSVHGGSIVNRSSAWRQRPK